MAIGHKISHTFFGNHHHEDAEHPHYETATVHVAQHHAILNLIDTTIFTDYDAHNPLESSIQKTIDKHISYDAYTSTDFFTVQQTRKDQWRYGLKNDLLYLKVPTAPPRV